MKTRISIVLLVVMVVISPLTAFSASAAQPTPPANPTAPITLKFDTFYPPTHMLAEPLRRAPAMIQELTQGRVKIDTFFYSKLFPATAALIVTSKGMADISHQSVQYQCGDVPLCSLEGGTAFVNIYAAQKAMPELMKIFQKELDRMGFGVKIAYNTAATGIEMNSSELKKAGERAYNLWKLLNVREGFSSKDDKIPSRWFEPVKGKIEGEDVTYRMSDFYKTRVLTPDDVQKLVQDYYDERGWDVEKGVATREKLAELGLEQFADALEPRE